MFTIKVVRYDANEKQRLHLYEARRVDVFRDGEGLEPGEHWVVFRDENDDEPCILVTNDTPRTSDEFVCPKVYVENRYGKTTEVVKAFNEPNCKSGKSGVADSVG